ncbi:MAG: glutathione S-transferase family protein [Myxococcota bacterium]
MQSPAAPPFGDCMLRVYGSRISYYTGKLEAYLRYRGIDYVLLPTEPHRKAILAGAGAVQMPVVELPDGRWMSDTTPILDWLESQPGRLGLWPATQRAAPSILPADPALRFVARLLEDYADEWLWRASMHHRWSHRLDREHASGLLADELLGHLWYPRAWKRRLLARRQYGGFVRGDGVTERTRAHVEQGVLRAYEALEAVLARRRFLLGGRPSLADFGFMGPMFRHLSMDPTPADRMRDRAPRVYAWVARMWNAPDERETVGLLDTIDEGATNGRLDAIGEGATNGLLDTIGEGATNGRLDRIGEGATNGLLDTIDEPIGALVVEACETHLVQLRENARAFAEGRTRFDQDVQGVRYVEVPVSRYRVWCLERLRREWAELDDEARRRLREWLPDAEAAVLWQPEAPARSGYDPEGLAPFNRAINVFGRGVPR